MPKFQLTSPDGQKYEVEGPEGATPEEAYGILQGQLRAQSGNTRGGDFARGLLHGASESSGLSLLRGEQPADPNQSGWRSAGEAVGGAVPPIIAGAMAPEALVAKGMVGAGMGALQPASGLGERLENTAIGAGSSVGLSQLGRFVSAHRGALNKLLNEGVGSAVGYTHAGPWGGLGGIWAGRNIGGLLQSLAGGRGLADFIAAAAKNPGLAAYLGIKAAPGAAAAGKIVGEQLGEPSQ